MPTRPLKKVAFIGLGRMGAPIAHHINRAGYDLTVHNRSPAKMDPFIELGVQAAASPREAAQGAQVVVTCLMDDQSMLANVQGEDGILAGLAPGGIHIGTATVSPACARQLAELHQAHGSRYLSAPIFGRPDAAEAGTLLTYLAGDREAAEACEPLFKTFTQTRIYMGEDPGLVNSIKLSMNFALVSLIEVFSEVYTFAEKSGLDLEFTEKLIHTVLSHPVLKEYTTRIRTRDFEPAAFTLQAGFKDVELMLQTSTQVQAPLMIARGVHEKLLTALARGMAAKDWSATYEISRLQAGLD